MDGPQEVEFARLLLTGISIMLILSLAVILFVVMYQRKLFKQQLRLQQIQAEHQQSLMSASFQAQEKERKRIASDLHDEVGATLSASKLYASQIKESDLEMDKLKALAAKMDDLVDEAIMRVRQISHNLLPPTLEKLGLNSALRDLANTVSIHDQFQVEVNCSLARRLPIQTELNMFRIVQELLNNTLKHSMASRVNVLVSNESGSIRLKYSDNGVGYDAVENGKHPTGLGINTLKSRSKMLGTDPIIESSKGKGMSFTITFNEAKDSGKYDGE